LKYVDEFRDRKIAETLAARIRERVDKRRRYTFMEVCGTHTMNIFKFGIRKMLPENIRLISGPGCPVCVTPNEFIDKAIELSKKRDTMIATFGDMMRVPGSRSSLQEERSGGRDVRVVYSTLDALEFARKNPRREVIFLGIGFETTAPTIASSITEAKRIGLENYSVLSGHKTMPNALRALAKDKEIPIDGFILPAHVSAIIGSRPYEFLVEEFGMRCVIAGFEPLDILQGLSMLVEQKMPALEIQYSRVVKREGNRAAQGIMKEVFEESSSTWRGIGDLAKSGLRIRRRYADFDAEEKFDVEVPKARERSGCICGAVLKGVREPTECKLFKKICIPENPIGPCMVSSEGTCSAYFKYGV
jgi:hydrogenase expression/formation protein HypD